MNSVEHVNGFYKQSEVDKYEVKREKRFVFIAKSIKHNKVVAVPLKGCV